MGSIFFIYQDLKEHAPLLYFWYAEMEMEICRSSGSSESEQHAIHILSCLGGNTNYTPFKCQPSGLQILRARQGFKEQCKVLRSAWVRGNIKEYSVAFICAASLFEALTTGLDSGIEVMEEAFSMALPGHVLFFVYFCYLINKSDIQTKCDYL